jgi:LysR family transcriptional regulator, nitrogen assimilation regulatory protein
MIDVQQLECFCAVVRSGSFSKAAAALSIGQPGLSRHVRRLEEQLGSKLLYRNGRGVALTPAGSQFHATVSVLIAQLKEAYDSAAQDSEAPAGHVTLGLPTSMAGLVGAPVLRDLKARYPHIDLSLIDGFSGHIHEWLVSGRIDMAILHDARHAPSIAVEPLSSEDLFLIGPKTPPGARMCDNETIIALRDIATLPLVIPGPDHGLRRQIDRVIAEVGVKLSVESDVDSLTVIKELIGDGGVYTILPFGCVYQEVPAGTLRVCRIVDPPIVNTFVLAAAQGRPFTAAMRTVRNALRAQVALAFTPEDRRKPGNKPQRANVVQIAASRRRFVSA